MPFGQIFNQGVRYIKVNRFDSGGLDRSDYLGQLTNLTITYDDLGPIEYTINTTQEQDTYFVYEIQTRNQSTSSVNYEVLNYNLTASKSNLQAPTTVFPVLIVSYSAETGDSPGYFNPTSGLYTFGNTPNVPIQITLNVAGANANTVHYIFKNFGSSAPIEDIEGNGSVSVILTGSNSIIEGDTIEVRVANLFFSASANISMSFTTLTTPNPATSSLVIFEPEFIDFEYNDYNALFGNAETPQFSFQLMDVDYTTDFTAPVNFDLIISGTADRALVQDSNYTSEAWSNLRYNGVKSEAPDFNQLTTEGGLGFEPNVEQNKTFLAYFDNVYGTGPELIGQTAYNVKYLIDTNGAVSNPEPGLPALYNIIDSFESGKNAVVRLIDNDPLLTQNPNDDALTGLHPITSVGRISSILVTETGSKIPDYVRTMSFTDVNGNQLNPNVVNFQGSARREGEFYMNNTNWTPIPFNLNYQNPPFSPIWGQAGIFNAPNGTYTFNSSSIEGNTSVFLNFSIRMRNPSPLENTIFLRVFNYTTNQEVPYPNSNGGFNTSTTIQIQGNGGEARIVPGNGSLFIFSGGSSYTQVFGGKLGPLNISDGDEIGLEYRASSGDPNRQVVFVTNSGTQILGDTSWDPFFEIGQLYPPGEINVNGDNIATSSYWSQGSNEYVGLEAINYNLTTTITASQTLTELWNKGRKQTLPTASAEIGFSPIGLPFSQELNSPAPGDWIRFEYNKDYRLFNITEVGTTTESTGSLYLKLYPAFTSGSIQLDHFVMYRILNDGTYVILDIDKPVSGSSFTGVIQPEYVSQELIDKYSDIIQDLTQRGVIS
jgi:hypothetical protein